MSMQLKAQEKTKEKRIVLNTSGYQELAKYYIFVLDCFDFSSVALSLFLGYCERKSGRISAY